MSARLLNNLLEELSPVSAASLRLLIVYEDTCARALIQEIYARLAQKLSNEFEFGCAWMGFEELNSAAIATEAALAAVDADVILFSVNANTEPSAALKAWVESWILCKKPKDAALGALFNQSRPSDGRAMPFEAYLREVAQRARMDSMFEVISTSHVSEAPAAWELARSSVPAYHNAWNEAGPLSELWPD